MAKIIDISLPVVRGLPAWPGSPEFKLVQVASLAEDGWNESRLEMGSHFGTHVDAPFHFLEGGGTIDRLPLDVLVGRVCVVECLGVAEISATLLSRLELPRSVDRLLIKTDNSELWRRGDETFFEDFSALTLDGAEWLAERGVKLVGVDYLSVQRFHDPNETHLVLLREGVVIVEGLNLSAVRAGEYDLSCLPLNVVGAEGAPARAILREI